MLNRIRGISYVIVTPVRNEERYIETTIKSVINQTVNPKQWIIVNDGSKDDTPKIIDTYSKRFHWIKSMHRNDRGHRKPGSGVIEAFLDGYDALDWNRWDYIVKLDGDLFFKKDYFERCFRRFIEDPTLGIAGGTILSDNNGNLIDEQNPLFHVRGATKIYKKQCWDAIGKIQKIIGWDTIDEVKANMLGWRTETFKDIFLVQLRPTGIVSGTWKNFVKNGRANYISGYHPVFFVMKCILRLFRKPYILGSIGLFFGYVSSYFLRTYQIQDKKLIKYIRTEQLKRLMLKKTIWH